MLTDESVCVTHALFQQLLGSVVDGSLVQRDDVVSVEQRRQLLFADGGETWQFQHVGGGQQRDQLGRINVLDAAWPRREESTRKRGAWSVMAHNRVAASQPHTHTYTPVYK